MAAIRPVSHQQLQSFYLASENTTKIDNYIQKHGLHDLRTVESMECLGEKLSERTCHFAYRSYNTPHGKCEGEARQFLHTKEYQAFHQTIYASLYLPDRPSSVHEQWPAVILTPGGTSISQVPRSKQKLIDFFTQRQIACCVTDPFTPRDIYQTTTDQFQLSAESSLIDVFQALRYLSTNPHIKRDQVAICGFSRGALVADLAARLEYQQLLSPDLPFAAHIIFYPPIFSQEMNPRLTQAPIIYFVGENDDLARSDIALAFIHRLEEKGCRNITTHVYKGRHGFNIPEFGGLAMGFMNFLYDCHCWWDNYPAVQKLFDCVAHSLAGLQGQNGLHELQNLSLCCYLYDQDGFWPLRGNNLVEDIKLDWNQFPDFIDSTVKYGGHLRYNKEADQKSLADAHKFLQQHLV